MGAAPEDVDPGVKEQPIIPTPRHLTRLGPDLCGFYGKADQDSPAAIVQATSLDLGLQKHVHQPEA